ncbi:MAG: hypothetical protein P8X55_19295, partial [Desulfosarcinaceae bacterium]
MTKPIRNRFILLGLLFVGAVYCLIPSLAPNLPQSWHKFLPTSGLRLGLDLQGGMHLILRVDTDKAAKNYFDTSMVDYRASLRKARIAVSGVESTGPFQDRLRLLNPGDSQSAMQILSDQYPNLETTGQGEGSLDIRLRQKEIDRIKENAVSQSLEVIRNRIDLFGVEEPVIVRQGADEIVVQLAGVKDPERAIQIVGRTAQLEFKLVDPNPTPGLDRLLVAAEDSGRLKPGYTHQELNQVLKNDIPQGTEVYIEKITDSQTGVVTRRPILLRRQVLMTGDAVRTARVEIGGRLGEPQVGLTLTDRGARLFQTITQQNVGQRLAI